MKKNRRDYNPDRAEYKKTLKRCRYCKTTEKLTVDHKVPLSIGGKDEAKNWQCLCLRCNQMKSAMTHNQVLTIFKWFIEVQDSREAHGKKRYTLQ